MFSYLKPYFIEKILWKSVFSNFGKNRNGAKKIGYLVAILKRYNILIFFSGIMVFDSSYIYGANFTANFPVEKWFSKGLHRTPLVTNGSKRTFVT